MAIGAMLFFMFIILQLAIWNLIPAGSNGVLLGMPQAPIMSHLSPITQGDVVLISLITGYGAIWGIRLFGNAYKALMGFLKLEKESIDNPTTA